MANEKKNFGKWGRANRDLGIFSRFTPSQIKLEFLSQSLCAPISTEPKRSLFAMSLLCPSLLLSLPYACAVKTTRTTLNSHSDEEEPIKYKPIT